MLNKKVIIVTGGAGLIGKSFVSAIVDNGGIPIIADKNIENAQACCDEINKKNGTETVDVIELDITSEKSLDNSIKVISSKYGRIDALVNNAYPRNENYGKHFFEVQYEDFVENVGLNLGGYFLASQRYSAYFSKYGGGNIINIASIYGVVAPKFHIYNETKMTTPVEYAAIKSGLIHLTKYMAKYFQGKNIRVNALSPGGILDRQPEPFLSAYQKECCTKGMLNSGDMAGTLIFLLSDMSAYINGQNIIVDDGFTL